MQLDRGVILQNLEQKGFQSEERRKHTFLIHHDRDGRKTGIQTFVSRGSSYKSLDSTLVGAMARQCRITTSQFVNLVNCSLSQDDYYGLVGE